MALKLTQSKFRLQQYVYNNWVAEPEYATPLSRVMEADYFGNIAIHVKAGDTIEVKPDGLPYYAKLIVIACDKQRVFCKVLSFVDLLSASSNEVPGQTAIIDSVDVGAFRIEKAARWFRVVRTADKEVMKTGFSTMDQAEAWAADNLKVSA